MTVFYGFLVGPRHVLVDFEAWNACLLGKARRIAGCSFA
jgi:hypothetical protein